MRLPLASLDVVPLDIVNDPALSSVDSKIHLLANLAAFTPPRYSALPVPAFATYLQLCALIMNAVPTHALEPPANRPDATKTWADGDDTDDEDETKVEVVSSFEEKQPLPQLDDRTRKRLQALPSSDHISTLLRASHNDRLTSAVIAFCFALVTVWPTRRDKVLGTMVAYNRGGLVREIYRSYVRSSPLGRDDSYAEVTSA